MIFKNSKVYEILKYIDLVVLPALIVFLGVIFGAIGYEGQMWLTILGGFDVFLGSLLGVSANQYKKIGDENNEDLRDVQTDEV